MAKDAPKIALKNKITDILLTSWKAIFLQLIPSLSPLASFLTHPLFQQAAARDDFSIWKKGNMDQFQKLGIGQSMYTKEVLEQQIEKTEQSWFQYAQVRHLVYQLMKRSNVFRLLTKFEVFLIMLPSTK